MDAGIFWKNMDSVMEICILGHCLHLRYFLGNFIWKLSHTRVVIVDILKDLQLYVYTWYNSIQFQASVVSRGLEAPLWKISKALSCEIQLRRDIII